MKFFQTLKTKQKMQIFFAVVSLPQTVRFVTFMWSTIISTTFSLINHKAVNTGIVRYFHSYSDDDGEHSKTLPHNDKPFTHDKASSLKVLVINHNGSL